MQSTADLVIDVIARMNAVRSTPTNYLTPELCAVTCSPCSSRRRLRTASGADDHGGIASMISIDQGLADAVDAATVEPWAEVHLLFLRRAVDRGEIAATVDVGTLSTVIPSMAVCSAVVQRRPDLVSGHFGVPATVSPPGGLVSITITRRGLCWGVAC
ncbi:TetR/AcrR family transcriptional regulator C-terminal ligand-binding domain-containing protein [Dactylosporangium sp. NPDC000244]|uniref:TetR/AcrR family transcriptional regulator C-terminal ligand-binding domain-containing protein n=1 Tax=Dactylosporangium sp. NPDC000244 TaxID=3154365 RepID=UPI003317A3DC